MQEVRLTPTSYIVLGLLELAGESTPYGLKQLVSASVGNFWTLHHAQLYTEPERLAKGGYVTREARARRAGAGGSTRSPTRAARALDDWRRETTSVARRAARARPAEALLRRRPGRLAEAQLPAHRAKLAEYEAIRGGMPDDVPRGPRLALEAGMRNERDFDRVLGGARRGRLGLRRMATAAEPQPGRAAAAAAAATAQRCASTRFSPPPSRARPRGSSARRAASPGARRFGLGVPKDQWLKAPIQAFLARAPERRAGAVDTGFHASVAVNPRSNLGALGTVLYRDIDMRPEQAVAAQLRDKGIEPSSVKAVIMTHLHPDHASAIADFPEATFLVSTAEWEAATHGGQRDGYVKRQFDHGFDYRLVDFDSNDANSFSGFARSFDVFGDGSVRIVFTPGHTAGHMSVVRADAARRGAARRRRDLHAPDARGRRTSPTCSSTSTSSAARCARSSST